MSPRETKYTSMEFFQKTGPIFRLLRNRIKDKTLLSDLIDCSWPTVQLYLKEAEKHIEMSNDYFAGIYLSENGIQYTVIDYKGNTIENKKIVLPSNRSSIVALLLETLKQIDYSNIKGLTISSDNYFHISNIANFFHFPPTAITIDKLRAFIPSECSLTLTRTNFANCIVQKESEWKAVNSRESRESVENKNIVVISCNNGEVFSTLIHKGKVIQKSPNLTNFFVENDIKPDFKENFFERYILPNFRLFSPDKFIFFSTKEEDLDWIQKYFDSISWNTIFLENKPYLEHFILPTLEINKTTPAESTALYSMYAYYGWEL